MAIGQVSARYVYSLIFIKLVVRCEKLGSTYFFESIFEQCILHLVNALQVNHILVLKLL